VTGHALPHSRRAQGVSVVGIDAGYAGSGCSWVTEPTPPSARVLRSGRVTNHRPIEKRYLRVDCTRQCGVPNLANMTSALHLLLSTIPKIQLPCISIENIDIQIELIQIPIKLISIRMKLSDDLCNHSDNLYQSKRRSRPCFTNQFGLLPSKSKLLHLKSVVHSLLHPCAFSSAPSPSCFERSAQSKRALTTPQLPVNCGGKSTAI
jgi:hypothetical protein